MKVIYWDTSTEWIVIEIFDLNQIEYSDTSIDKDLMIENIKSKYNLKSIYSFKEFLPKVASTGLVALLKVAMQEASIDKPDWLITAKGPGSFTGIRIAVATARNLAQLWNIPCLGLDTMEIYARYYANQYPEKDIAVILDGKMKKYYFHKIDANQIHSNQKDQLTKDLTWDEIRPLLNQETQVFSHTEIPIPHTLFREDYPTITGIPIESYWNHEFLERTNDSTQFHYETLLPKYMRDTYATKPLPKS